MGHWPIYSVCNKLSTSVTHILCVLVSKLIVKIIKEDIKSLFYLEDQSGRNWVRGKYDQNILYEHFRELTKAF